MKRVFLLIGILAALGFILNGCSLSTDPEDDADIENFGSFRASDEEPYFGDTELEEIITEGELDYDDPVAYSPLIDSLRVFGGTDIFCFRMAWGNLEHDTVVTELTDWSGKLTISRGAIVVKKLILFEPGQDYLLPRYNDEGFYVPEELRWVSQTSWHFDGIATKLFIPPSVTDEVVTITYESEQLTISFPMDRLEKFDTLINIGYGNAISFQSVRFDPVSRLHGSLAGRWGLDDDGNGVFMGKWLSAAGTVMGSVKGEWGFDDNGRPVFVGKWIDDSGNFEGFLKGHWRVSGRGYNAAGQFWGRIYDADKEPIGILRGHFKKGETRKGGYFAGRWCVGCRIPAVSAYQPFE